MFLKHSLICGALYCLYVIASGVTYSYGWQFFWLFFPVIIGLTFVLGSIGYLIYVQYSRKIQALELYSSRYKFLTKYNLPSDKAFIEAMKYVSNYKEDDEIEVEND